MAAERPPIDAFFAAPQRPAIDSFFKGVKKGQPPRPESIYRKGGAYDQFGPTPPVFDPRPGDYGGMVQAGADQPGAAIPFIGQAIGGFGGPILGIGGAMAGEVARQGIGRAMGVQDNTGLKQLKKAGENAAFGEVLGLGTGKAIEMGAKALGPAARKTGIRLAQNVIRPTGKYAKRGEQIAENALKEGVLRSGARETAQAAQAKIDPLMQEVNTIAASIKDKTMTAEGGLRRMDALAKWYSRRGDSSAANKVLEIKQDIIRGENLMMPVYGQKETSQFVMGPASKSVTPKITSIKGEKISRNIEPTFDPEKGEYINEIVTPQKFMEKPEDIVSLSTPGKGTTPRKITSISPKETYSIRPKTLGVSKKETVMLGNEPREFSIKKGLELRRGQDALLKTKRADAGYYADTKSADIMGRQEFIGGLRKDIGKASPEIAAKNKRISGLIDVSKASGKRADVSSRNNLMDLTDSVMGTAAAFNPKALALLLTRKAYQGGKAGIAKTLYGLPGVGGDTAALLKSPATRALLSRIYEASRN